MAERRMFAKSIIDSDVFLDMPLSTQALYFHLSMRADDEGFINNPKKIMRMIGASQNELEILLAKRYLLSFDSGVVVIKHWRIHNYIQNDRFKETLYKEERAQIVIKDNKSYTEANNPAITHENTPKTPCIHNVSSTDTEGIQNGDTGKTSIGKFREDKLSKDYKEKNNKKENSSFPSFSEFPGNKKSPQTEGQKSISNMITEAIDHWNSFEILPACKYTIYTLPSPDKTEIIKKFDVFREGEVLQAITNLAKFYDKINPTYRPKIFHRFVTNSLDNWLDSAEPWRQFESDKPEQNFRTEEERKYHMALDMKNKDPDNVSDEWVEQKRIQMEESLSAL